ncbi:MAG: serine protease [Patescibacteria group bacterium]
MRRIIIATASIAALASLSGVIFAGYYVARQLGSDLQSTKLQLALIERQVGSAQQQTSDSFKNLRTENKSLAQELEKSQSEIDHLALPQNLLNQVMSRIVWVHCQDANGSHERAGSGTIGLTKNTAKGVTITTNFHVTGSPTSFCVVKLPEAPSYAKLGVPRVALIGKYDPNYPEVDIALLHLFDAKEKFDAFPLSYCQSSEIKIGDRITLLGYPAFGGNTLTITDGIISGTIQTKYGPRYKTSAKIDLGNSGGLAIDNNNRCVIGIPTWTKFGGELGEALGTGESLGQIQSWEIIKTSGQIF